MDHQASEDWARSADVGSKVRCGRKALMATMLIAAASLGIVWLNTLFDPSKLKWDKWAYSELLINYEGGFVRRGLLGQLFHDADGTNTLIVVNEYVFYTFAALTVVIVLNALYVGIVRGSGFAALICLVMPGGILSMALGNEYYYRKEVLFFVFVYVLALARHALSWLGVERLPRKTAAALWVCVSLLSLALLFIHENFLFLCAPAIVLLMYGVCEREDRIMSVFAPLLYLAALVALFGALAVHRGDSGIVAKIWESIGPISRKLISDTGQPAGGIAALNLGLLKAMSWQLIMVVSGYAPYWMLPIVVSMLGAVTYALLTSIAGSAGGPRGLVVYALLFLGASPLFLLACDWGRWIAATNLIFLAVFPCIPTLPPKLSNAAKVLSGRLFVLDRNTLARVAVAVILMSLFVEMPECCIGGSASRARHDGSFSVFPGEF